MADRRRVLVLGAGAIGGYVGGSLARAGHEVVFLSRAKTAEALRKGGLRLGLPEGEYVHHPVIAEDAQTAFQNRAYDLLVFAVKRYDTGGAVQTLAQAIAPFPPVLNLQNGIGAEEEFEALLPEARSIPGTVTTAVGRPERTRIVVERFRGVGVAGGQPEARAWAALLDGAGLNCRYYADPAAMKWSKLLTNLTANPISAILDLPPTDVFAHPGLYRLEMRQLREALAVMRAIGARVVDLPGTPVRLLAFFAQLPVSLSRPFLARALGAGRGGKMPSFHRDLHGGAGRSEIGWLHGAVADYGKRLGIPTPVNAGLVELLEGMLSGRIDRNAYRRQPGKLLARF